MKQKKNENVFLEVCLPHIGQYGLIVVENEVFQKSYSFFPYITKRPRKFVA